MIQEESNMTRFFKKWIGASSTKEQGNCCGVEIKEVEDTPSSDTPCCSDDSDSSTPSCCS
jgi:hypothetical protein